MPIGAPEHGVAGALEVMATWAELTEEVLGRVVLKRRRQALCALFCLPYIIPRLGTDLRWCLIIFRLPYNFPRLYF
jgi:hypothetical protein